MRLFAMPICSCHDDHCTHAAALGGSWIGFPYYSDCRLHVVLLLLPILVALRSLRNSIGGITTRAGSAQEHVPAGGGLQ